MENKENKYVYVVNSFMGARGYDNVEGIFSNKKSAMKKYREIVKKMSDDKPDIPIPLNILMEHINDFESNGNILYMLDETDKFGVFYADYLFHSHMEYNADTWKEAFEKYLYWKFRRQLVEVNVQKRKVSLIDNFWRDIETLYRTCKTHKVFFEFENSFTEEKCKSKNNCNYKNDIEYAYIVEEIGGQDISIEGVFSNEETAIEKCNNLKHSIRRWVNDMKVPLDIYIKHINDLRHEKIINGYRWRKHMDYSGKKWDHSHSTFTDNGKHYEIEIRVVKHFFKENKREIIYTEKLPAINSHITFDVTKRVTNISNIY